MAFVFVSILLVCFGELEVIPCSSIFCQCLRYCTRPVAGQIPVLLGSAVYSSVAIYACGFRCACSLTMRSVWGVLLSFSVFSPPSSPLIIIIISIIIVLISPLNSRVSVTGAWPGNGCSGQGSWRGCG